MNLRNTPIAQFIETKRFGDGQHIRRYCSSRDGLGHDLGPVQYQIRQNLALRVELAQC